MSTLSEQVALTRALEEIEKPKAQVRQQTGQFGSVPIETGHASSANGRVADLAARAAGFSSPSTYHRAGGAR